MKNILFTSAALVLSFNVTFTSQAIAYPDYDDREEYYDSLEERRMDAERERLELERDRLDSERSQFDAERYNQRHQNSAAEARTAERCPAGFQQSEQKCSNEERKRGCKDMRLPGGLGCVSR